jgi:cellulose synthase/poly-beta-1,6-N-acetylglucosamine synthase-like glycosyltransferase
VTPVEALFWISAVLVGYVYVGYPLLTWLLARLAGRPVERGTDTPQVTVLTAAFNEAQHIRETVANKLAQHYPEELLEVIVVSDGSTDGTDEIVRSLGPRVKLIRQEPRAGKTAALNRAAAEARGEILVFSDANSIYAPDAIRRLVANFADPMVGYATGRMVYVNADRSLVGEGCSAYMKYENWLRAQESRLVAVIGVDGGIDAVRRPLFRHMRADQLPDFVLPMAVAEEGYRVVYEPEALLFERTLSDHRDEYRMRVRVSLRALWALWDMRHLLNPFRHGMLAFQLISHKLLRYLSFVPLLLALLTSIGLAGRGGNFQAAVILQALVILLAVVGWTRRAARGPALISFPYYFLLVNIAAAHAVLRFLRGERQATWAPRTG